MIKFKLGQKVKIKENLKEGNYSSHHIYFADKMEKYTGKTVTIKELDRCGYKYAYSIEEDDKEWMWDEEWLEPVNYTFNIEDIQAGDIIELDNGDKLVAHYDYSHDIKFEDLDHQKNDNPVSDIDDIEEDGSINNYDHEYKVVSVLRPIKYETIYNRNSEVKEMTVEEISKALGYEVKIVKGE